MAKSLCPISERVPLIRRALGPRPAVLVACLVSLLWCSSAPAQSLRTPIDSSAPERARVRLGPFGITPSVGLTNLGLDTNVFNQADNPARDFTATLLPQLDAWFRAGRSRSHLIGRTELVYFQTYSSERSVNGGLEAKFEVPGNHLTPWAAAGYSASRQRLGYEIDLRSRRRRLDVSAGIEGRIASKTRLVFYLSRVDYRFDADDFFLGSGLAETLTRKSEQIGLDYRQSLTALSTLVISSSGGRDHFLYSPDRNADSARIEAGFDLDERALVSGRVRFGYRRFNGLHDLPDYSGLVASFTTGATLYGRVRVTLEGQRDIEYSVDRTYPYYVLTGGVLSFVPRLTQKWDTRFRVGFQRLAYRAADTQSAGRLDTTGLVGAGVGYHFVGAMRIGIDLDRQSRSSPVLSRDYSGLRLGTSVTYGR